MKKILITGGAGFIGCEIVKKLYATNEWKITVLDKMTPQVHGENWENSYLFNSIKDKCNFIYGDVRDLSIVEKAVQGQEYIIHLAAETGTGQSMYQINQYNEVNIMGTSNIFQAISSINKEKVLKKFILSSSRAVYGEGRYKCPHCGIVYPTSRKKEDLLTGDFNMYCNKCGEKLILELTTENSLIQPSSLYAYTKYAQEKMVETMCPAFEINYTIFRFQNVYGVGQSLKNPYTGILSIFSTLLLQNSPINIFEDGLESRDFINVMDIADGVIKSLYVPESNGEIINLGSGEATTVIEVAKYLKKRYNSTSDLNITGDFRMGDIAHNVADISKAKTILGFEQKIDLKTGLEGFCNWVMTQEKGSISYDNSLGEMEEKGMFIRKKK